MSLRRSAAEIEEEAARWVLRLDREVEPDALEAEFEAWLQEDSRHRGAMLKAEAAWMLLDGMPPEPSVVVSAPEASPPAWTGRKFTRRMVLGGAGAAIAASLVAFVALPKGGEQYTTAVGEIRRIALVDRTTAAINTASEIDVRYGEQRRIVRVQKGEVWFQVAKNKARPFLVEAGRVRVEAVGTAFSVRRRNSGAEVLVTEGAVRAWVAGAEGAVTRIGAGSRAFIAENAAVTRFDAQPSELDRKLAWRAGKIDLAGETLATAVSEFNRYNVRQISVADAEVAGKRFYGVFRSDDPEGFARAAATSVGARVSATPDGEIVIARTR